MTNKPFTLTAIQREEICQRYVAGESTVKLAKAYSVTKANIRTLLIRRGIPRRENTAELHRTYQCNHAYFDQPLDEERAYWIGFLLADGFVSYAQKTGNPIIGMTLATIDSAHVERFKSALQSNHPIGQYLSGKGYGAGKTMARFSIASLDLVKGVEKYGIVERKTQYCITPQLPPELMRHMYRGYVDGDGGLSLYQLRKWQNAALDVVGTESFLKDFALWLAAHAGSNPNVPLKSNNTTVIMNLRYGGLRQVSDILHVLYDDATVYLERKYQTAQDIWDAAQKQLSYRRNDYENQHG